MNDTNTLSADVSFRPSPHLLDAIRTIRASVGDGLNDNELTRFLRDSALPTEAGFAFLSFADGFVTLTVPPQDLTSWYPEKGWIVPEKERIARAIAEKYQLSLHEPPDVDSSYVYPRPDSANPHHHLELGNREETAILAHPHYLKVRLFGATSPILFARAARLPLLLSPELLPDLSALYKPGSAPLCSSEGPSRIASTLPASAATRTPAQAFPFQQIGLLKTTSTQRQTL